MYIYTNCLTCVRVSLIHLNAPCGRAKLLKSSLSSLRRARIVENIYLCPLLAPWLVIVTCVCVCCIYKRILLKKYTRGENVQCVKCFTINSWNKLFH